MCVRRGVLYISVVYCVVGRFKVCPGGILGVRAVYCVVRR